MKTLNQQIDEMESLLSERETQNLKVSAGSVGWHLEHNLLVINQVIQGIKSSDARLYKSRFSMPKWIVLTFGFIPAGKVKAPKLVTPLEEPSLDRIIEGLAFARENAEDLKHVVRNKYFEHPIFGHVNAQIAGRFLAVHTHHHLKIINEILR
jgi:hypothetical protein